MLLALIRVSSCFSLPISAPQLLCSLPYLSPPLSPPAFRPFVSPTSKSAKASSSPSAGLFLRLNLKKMCECAAHTRGAKLKLLSSEFQRVLTPVLIHILVFAHILEESYDIAWILRIICSLFLKVYPRDIFAFGLEMMY